MFAPLAIASRATMSFLVCCLALIATPSSARAEAVEIERFQIVEDKDDKTFLRSMQVTVIHPAGLSASTLREHRRAAQRKGRELLDVPRTKVLEELELLRHFLGEKMAEAGLVDERSQTALSPSIGALKVSAETERLLQSTTLIVSDVSNGSQRFDASTIERPRYVLRIFERAGESGLLPLTEKLRRQGKGVPPYARQADVEIGSYWKDGKDPLRGLVEIKAQQLFGEMLARRAHRKRAPLWLLVQTSEGARQRLYRSLGFKRRGHFEDDEESIVRIKNGETTKSKAKTVILSALGHRKIVRALQRNSERLIEGLNPHLLERSEKRAVTNDERGWQANDPALRLEAHGATRSSQRARAAARARRQARRAHGRTVARHR